jgi:hypothetical protein
VKGKTVKTTNNSTFNKDISKAIINEMVRRGLNKDAATYICSTYGFDTYLLEGSLSHLQDQISQAEKAAGI